jgi:hypothetical protein
MGATDLPQFCGLQAMEAGWISVSVGGWLCFFGFGLRFGVVAMSSPQ